MTPSHIDATLMPPRFSILLPLHTSITMPLDTAIFLCCRFAAAVAAAMMFAAFSDAAAFAILMLSRYCHFFARAICCHNAFTPPLMISCCL